MTWRRLSEPLQFQYNLISSDGAAAQGLTIGYVVPVTTAQGDKHVFFRSHDDGVGTFPLQADCNACHVYLIDLLDALRSDSMYAGVELTQLRKSFSYGYLLVPSAVGGFWDPNLIFRLLDICHGREYGQ